MQEKTFEPCLCGDPLLSAHQPSLHGDERCGLWVRVGDHETVCMRPIDHGGECRPDRAELMRQIEWHQGCAEAISKIVTFLDTSYEEWPARRNGANCGVQKALRDALAAALDLLDNDGHNDETLNPLRATLAAAAEMTQ